MEREEEEMQSPAGGREADRTLGQQFSNVTAYCNTWSTSKKLLLVVLPREMQIELFWHVA